MVHDQTKAATMRTFDAVDILAENIRWTMMRTEPISHTETITEDVAWRSIVAHVRKLSDEDHARAIASVIAWWDR